MNFISFQNTHPDLESGLLAVDKIISSFHYLMKLVTKDAESFKGVEFNCGDLVFKNETINLEKSRDIYLRCRVENLNYRVICREIGIENYFEFLVVSDGFYLNRLNLYRNNKDWDNCKKYGDIGIFKDALAGVYLRMSEDLKLRLSENFNFDSLS